MPEGFDGLMMKNVWHGLQIKKEQRIRHMPLYVPRLDGGGRERVIFGEVNEFHQDGGYELVGTCQIGGHAYTFEYKAPFGGRHNASIIGFQPVTAKIASR